MSRLIISFALALFSHLYLLQCHLDINEDTPPRLISDSSVSVTLNQNLEKQTDDSKQDLPKTEKKIEKESTLKTSHSVPPQTATSIQKLEQIKPTATKIKKTTKDTEPPQVKETQPVATVKSVALDKKYKVEETMEHTNNPVSSKGVVSEQDDSSSSSVIEAQPLYQYNPKPEYPGLARRRGWEGVVMLLVEVTELGKVASVRLHESCGYKILDKSAVRAVKTWSFLSGTRNGKRTLSTVLIPVHFKLYK